MAGKKPASKKPIAVTNRRARYDYELGDELVAGLSLTGHEVRAARDGHVQLKGSYVRIQNNELWLVNASFSIKHNERGIANARTVDSSPKKLLVKRSDISRLIADKQTGQTLVPLRLLVGGRFIKLVIAAGKGKRTFDKRETIKRRDIEREHRRQIR